MKKYLTHNRTTNPVPQDQRLNAKQVKNSAGGYTWQLSAWDQCQRFLILGSEGGTYYATERALTVENAQNVLACIREDGARLVRMIVEISDSGRAPKNDPAIFALAMATAYGDDATRALALSALPQVCRIGTHLFSFVEAIKGMRGWGRGMRRAVGAWYTALTDQQLAYQVIKYRQRGGWTHVDTLRKAHPQPLSETQDSVFKWVTQRTKATWAQEPVAPDNEALAFLWAFERVQDVQTVDAVVKLIKGFDLPREALPTHWLNDASVWEALLEKMPLTALIRNLGNMSKVKLLKANSEAEKLVLARLADADAIRKARVHPIAVLSALRVYGFGTALKGRSNFLYITPNQDWTPSARIIDALNTTFELAFQTIEPTHKRTMLALDVSGSMAAGYIAGAAGLTPREASVTMAMVTARTEPNYMFTAFSDKMIPLNISANMRLDDALDKASNLPFSGTDCALPMIYAQKNQLDIDTFVVYTDNETWAGKIHPAQALRDYRQKTGIPAKLIVVGMTATNFTIADPDDAGMMDVVGFDAAAPAIMADFSRQ